MEALRAALVVTAQRESAKQLHKSQWYKQCYDEIVAGFQETPGRERGFIRDDRIHGSLLVLNELLRCSNIKWERTYETLMEKLNCSSEQDDNSIILISPRLKSTVHRYTIILTNVFFLFNKLTLFLAVGQARRKTA